MASELEDTACEHCGAMAGACGEYPACPNGPTEADRLRGALNRLGEKNAKLEAALRSAHDELTNAGHQELPECECKIAALLRGSPSRPDNLSTGSALSDATEPREALRAGAASRDP